MTVSVAKLKAHLSSYLRKVRAGQEVVVTDHDHPVARIIPLDDRGTASFPVRLAKRPHSELKNVQLPEPLRKPTDSLSFLLEERGKER